MSSFPVWSKSSEQKTKLIIAFGSLKTTDEMEKAAKDFEAVCQVENDTDLGIVCANVALKLYDVDNSHITKPKLLLSYGNKTSLILAPFERYFCNNAFTPNNFNVFVVILRNLWLSGLACRMLERYNESLAYFERASKVGDTSYSAFEDGSPLLSILSVIENELATLKKKMGMPDDKIVPHFRKGTDIQEKYSDEYDTDFGRSCMNLCIGYVRLRKYREALPFCLKAVKIFTNNFGQDSIDTAEARKYLGSIYMSLGDHDKALEELRVSMGILKTSAPDSNELVKQEIQWGNYQISRGKYEEAIATLKAIRLQIVKDKELRAKVFLNMAQAYCRLGNIVDAKKYAETCRSILAKIEDQVKFAGVLTDLSKICDEIKVREQKTPEMEEAVI